MNIITPNFQAQFDAIRYRNTANMEEFMTLFNRQVHDQWPLQHRVYEYDFLKHLSPKKRDLEIMRYAIQCWMDVQACALKMHYSKAYISSVVFESEALTSLGMLWPQLYFFNSHLKSISNVRLTTDLGNEATYIKTMLVELNLANRLLVLEEPRSNDGNINIYIDYESVDGESRLPVSAVASVTTKRTK